MTILKEDEADDEDEEETGDGDGDSCEGSEEADWGLGSDESEIAGAAKGDESESCNGGWLS